MSTPTLVFRPESIGGVRVDLEQLIATRTLIQANSGGGKSRMLRYILEQTHGHIQQIIIDPEGEFASLREKFDYLLAGRDGDVPADLKTAKLLARRLLELNASAVIDLYELDYQKRRHFVRLFLDELMHLPRTLWRPVLIPIDEAHVFCPERGAGEAESTNSVIALCTQGRKRGFAPLLATQRISKLHKDAAAELLNKLIGRTGLDVDLKRAGDELGMDKETRQQLRDLEPGEFFAFGPAISRSVVKVRSGPIQTSHPQPGKVAPPAPPAPTAVKKLMQQMQDLQHEAEEEARTIADLQRDLTKVRGELKRAQRTTPAAAADPAVVQKQVTAAVARERKAVNQSHQNEIKKLRGALEAAMKFIINITAQNFDAAGVDKAELERAVSAAVAKATQMVDSRLEVRAKQIEKLRTSAQQIIGTLKQVLGDAEVVIDLTVNRQEPFAVKLPAKPRESPQRSIAPSVNGNGSLPKGEHAVLTAACQYPDGVTRQQLTILTAYKRSSRDAYIQRLREKGLVQLRGELVIAAEGAEQHLGDFEPLPTGEALQQYWLDRLPAGERAFLEELIVAHPNGLTRDELSDRTEYKRSSRDAYLQRMSAKQIIEITGGSVRAADFLFDT